MRNHVKLPQIQTVAAGARSHVNLPRGLTYDFIVFKMTNCVASDMENFKVTVGTKNIIDVKSAGTLQAISDYYDRPKTTGYFILWFYRPEFNTEAERSVFSLGTTDIGSLSMQWDLKTALTDPAIELWAMQRGPALMGTVAKIRELPVSYASGGEQALDSIQRTGDRIGAIHMHKTADDITNVSMDINIGVGPSRLIDMPVPVLEVVQKAHDRIPQAEYVHIDTTLLGSINEPLPTKGLQELLIRPTMTTGGTVTNVVEYFGGFAGA